MADIRYCAFCDQKVDKVPDGKQLTAGGEVPPPFKHISTSDQGVPNCGRQFLQEHETYTESDE